MFFNEKLDFIMNITKTTNSALAINTSLDPSYISRLRSGARKPAKNENYLKAMANYLARHCDEEYQKAALSDVLGSSLPGESKAAAKIIYKWFLDEKPDEKINVEEFLDELSHFQFKKSPPIQAKEDFNISQVPEGTSIYYGIEGKRAAVIHFLTLLLHEDKTQTLLLFSDEDMDWQMGNPDFTAKWADLVAQVILRGNKIKIIHTVSRDIDEMLAAISKWMPIYMSGAVEPYYYPKKRDGIYKRTLFAAPETAAVVSTSVGSSAGSAANFILRDQAAVKSMVREYESYLALCRPLMHIFTTHNSEDYLKTLEQFEKEEANAMIRTEALSCITLPDSAAEMIIRRVKNSDHQKYLACHQMKTHNFKKSLLTKTYFEIIKIPDPEMIRSGKVRVSFFDMMYENDIFYTVEEFILHLENIVSLLQTYENYHVYLNTERNESSYILYVKEDLGVLVARTSAPSVILAINESNLTAAFWDYMNDEISNVVYRKKERKQIIAQLQAVVEELKGRASEGLAACNS